MGNDSERECCSFTDFLPVVKLEPMTFGLQVQLSSPTLFFIEIPMELFSKNVHTVFSINSKRTAAYPELGYPR